MIIVAQFVLLFIIMKTLKKSLHYHYIRNKRNLVISTILTVMYFVFLLAPLKYHYFFNQSVNLMMFERKPGDNLPVSFSYFLTALAMQVLLNIYLGVYTVFNMRTIEFKIYLWDLLYGRRIIDIIANSSNK